MKIRLFLVVLFFTCIGIHCMAQESRFLQRETDSLGYITHAKLNTSVSPQPMSQSAELLRSMYSKRTTDEFKPSERRKEIRDELSFTHQYYQQYYKNVKVEYGEATVHSDKRGNIETVFGYFKPVGDVDTNPMLSEAQALEYALKHIGAETYKWQIPEEEKWIKEYYNDTYRPVGELVIVKDQLKTDKAYRLAYRFDIYAHQPISRNYVWVDAITGDILNMESRLRFVNATGRAATRYSGSRSITADSYNGSYRLRMTRNSVNISTFNMNHTAIYSSTDFTDNDNNWTTAEHSINNNNAALDAHWGAEMTDRYFIQVHGRNSWDNSGGALLSYVNANLGNNSDNAFWDVNRMIYGQGTFLPPLTTLDICAHEIAHGICQSTANLIYQGESGAINESLSDIWAACVENWATMGKDTWLIGEDLGFPLRNMLNPNALGQPDTHGGTNWLNVNGCIPDDDNDFCGVHRNSGVMNYWFYLLSEGGSGTNDNGEAYSVTGIGIEKASKILYRAEAYYMTANTDFADARQLTGLSAFILYGNFSDEEISVINAWHAVGVGGRHSPVIRGPSAICGGNPTTFTAANALTGFTWETSSNLTINYQSGNSVSVYSTGNSATGVINLMYGTQKMAGLQVDISYGSPSVSLVGPDDVVGGAYYYTTSPVGAGVATYYEWSIADAYVDADYNVFGQGNNGVYITFFDTGSYELHVKASNACDYDEQTMWVNVEEYSPSAAATYPNPARDILTVDLDAAVSTRQQPAAASRTAAADYDLRLYDGQGNLLRSAKTGGGTVQFNVANLPNGIYYLHIYDGVNPKPEIQQIAVEH